MNESRVKISGGGRVVIPAEYRKAMGLQEGDEVILRLDDKGELRILTLGQAIQYAKQTVRRYVSKDRSLANELIAERNKEYENE